MRTFGLVLLVGGIFGYIYSTDQLAKAPPLPEGIGWQRGLEHPAGKWDTIRYACAASGGAQCTSVICASSRARLKVGRSGCSGSCCGWCFCIMP